MPFTGYKVSVRAEHVAVTYTNSKGSAIQLHATTNRTISTTLAVAKHFKLITHPNRKGVAATNYHNNNNEVIVPASDEINTDDDVIIPSLTLSSSSSLAPISIVSSTFNESSSTASTITTTTTATAALNVTQESSEVPEIPAYIRTTAMFFCIVIMLMGVIGNVMVPIVIIRTKDMRNSTNIFLTNLSIADILVLLVCTPTVLVELNTRPETWVLGHEMCKAVPFIELTVAHASVLTILAISFERYYAICEPLKAGYVCTKTRAILICSLAWGIAALFTSPILWVAEYKYVDYIDGSSVPVCLTQALTIWTMGFFVMTVTVFFILPLFILIVLYGIIAKNLISNNGPMMRIRPTKPELSLKARKQVVLMLGAVVLAFFLCLLPFHLFTMWIVLDTDQTILDIGVERYYSLLYFCRIMWYLNSAINPVLYNLMSTKFRKGFYKLTYSVWLAVISWLSCGRCGAWRKRSGTNAVTATTTTSSNTNTTTNTSSSILSRSSNRRSSDEICTRTRVQIQMQIPHGSDCEMVAMLHNNSTDCRAVAVVAASLPALNRYARAGGRAAAVVKSHPQRRLSSSPTSPANQQHSQQQHSVQHHQHQPLHHPHTHEQQQQHHHHHHHVVCSRFKTKQISFEEEAALA